MMLKVTFACNYSETESQSDLGSHELQDFHQEMKKEKSLVFALLFLHTPHVFCCL